MSKVYSRIQVACVISIAAFILSFALCLLVWNNRALVKGFSSDTEGISPGTTGLTAFEKQLIYTQLTDSFVDSKAKSYEIAGYKLSKRNTRALDDFKKKYLRAEWISLISGVLTVLFMAKLKKRRMFDAFVTGGVLAGACTALNAMLLMALRTDTALSIKAAIFHGEYDFLTGDDVLKSLLPSDFFGRMAGLYVLYVVLLALIFAFIKWFIGFLGRPHRF